MKDSYILGYLLNLCWQARSCSLKSIIVMEQDVGSAVRKASSMDGGQGGCHNPPGPCRSFIIVGQGTSLTYSMGLI